MSDAALRVPEEIEQTVDVRELAGILKIKPGTIYLWVRHKSIPFIKVGGKFVRFRISEINRWLDAQSVQPANITEDIPMTPATSSKSKPSKFKTARTGQKEYIDIVFGSELGK